MVAGTRFLLAFSALVITFIDPSEPVRLVMETYELLILYTLYSLFVLVSMRLDLWRPAVVRRDPWWIDTSVYLVLVSLSSGTSSMFFFLFFFAVLTAAFARGFPTAFAVSVVSAIGFSIVAWLSTPPEEHFDLGRFLLRPMSLLVLGYLMSRWGGYETRSRRRLELLRQIGAVSNPRFGVDRTVAINLEVIRSFYGADGCLFVMLDPHTGHVEVRLCAGNEENMKSEVLKPGTPLATRLVAPPENIAAMVALGSIRRLAVRQFHAFDRDAQRFVDADASAFEPILEVLSAASMVTTPIFYRQQYIGRFFVYSSKTGTFAPGDLPFVDQAVGQLMPIVENIRLVDQMASDAAEHERKRIARDIHDSIIQPYIGLQIGIESLVQLVAKRPSDATDASRLVGRVEHLKRTAEQGIDDLRNYVHGLSGRGRTKTALRESLESFAAKYSAGTGIEVRLDYGPDLAVGDRLAAEVFQIVAEALSNVRKHSHSETATVRVAAADDQLTVEISNRRSPEIAAGPFMPRSIAQRTESLGGSMAVRNYDGRTTVSVRIPM